MFLCDYHIHTHFSFDGDPAATHDALCRRALELGLSAIAFTDHCDINGEVEGFYAPYRADEAFAAMQEVKARYAGRLQVLAGLELGNPHQYPAEAAAVLAAHPYDFVIGSLHNLRDVPDFYYLSYADMPDALIARLIERALDETLELIQTPGLTVLGHITYPHRYITKAGRPYSFKPHYEKLKQIFRILVERDIALELNVSPLRQGLGITLPTPELLKLYRDCGGRLITVGSDSHKTVDLGRDIRRGYALLRAAGLTEIMTLHEGERILRPIL